MIIENNSPFIRQIILLIRILDIYQTYEINESQIIKSTFI